MGLDQRGGTDAHRTALREAYGATATEKLDIYRTKRAKAPIFVFIHGGACHRDLRHPRNSRVPAAGPLHAALARRTLLRMDTMAASHPRPLGVPHPELPGLFPARLPRCPLQAILR
jgi:hypothetical protein